MDTVQDGLANLHAILIDSHINENKHRHAHTLRHHRSQPYAHMHSNSVYMTINTRYD